MRRTVIGVMGGTEADEATAALAFEVGRLIAGRGWVLLSGGRPGGVMQASVSGARAGGGLTVGVLYGDDRDDAAEGLDLVIPTGLGAARNVVNILASDVVVACRGTGGTLSEIALALRFGRPVVLVDFDPGAAFLDQCAAGCRWAIVADAPAAIERVEAFLREVGRT
ncbi:MAG: hypothetical protein IPI48_07235 [bacterium]|jgi:uncharacterized protein (TIGR00725 family)|nr:hypothetical protein [bacterium]MBK7770311.1 hypothetical protein [bacterium]MBK9777007.1 hypothetical protein [bacterium]